MNASLNSQPTAARVSTVNFYAHFTNSVLYKKALNESQ